MEMISEFLQDQSTVLAGTALATLSAAALWFYQTQPKPIDFPISLDDQSVEIEPGVRASKFAADGKFLEYIYEDVRTTHEALLRGLRVSNNGPCIGRQDQNRTYKWFSYQEIYDQAQQLGSAFLKLGLKACDETFIGIYSPNCTEWVVSQEACSMFSMVVVPLYDTLGEAACEHIINQTEMQVVICDKGPKANLLLTAKDRLPTLKYLVVIDGSTLTKEIIEAGRKIDVKISSFEEMLKLGSTDLRNPVPPKPETICAIYYTSGTTGTPKGVILSHKALIANVSSCLVNNGDAVPVTHRDIHLAYLPLAHMYERMAELMMIIKGGKIGFSSGNIQLLFDDLAILQPTFFAVVPRLLNRIYDKVQLGVSSSWIKRTLLDMAIQHKTNLLRRCIITRGTVWDWLVFGKIQKLLGGQVRFSVVTSAALSANVNNFARCSFGCFMIQGYGQTELTAGITLCLPIDYDPVSVGPPLACCHVKLVDIPEMDYYAKDGKGEICARGSSMMNGYYKEPEKTRETIDEEGWVHTGDVGQWLPNGTLKIIDRKKHIFKLAQGEYVAPEKIEGVYSRCQFLAQIFVDGDGLQTYPVAIGVPEEGYVIEWAKENLGEDLTFRDLCKNKALKEAILKDLSVKGKEGHLKGFEQVKNIYLSADPFTIENGLLTPTLKSKRQALRKAYEAEINDLYR